MTDSTNDTAGTALVAGASPASKTALAAMSMVHRGAGGGIVLMPTNFGEVIAMAEMMARADTAVPKHLRGNGGACMAVIIRATGWEMDAFAVATKTYLVNDQIAYESQLVSAVVNMRAPVKGRPRISYEGEGPEMRAHFEYTMEDGEVLGYDSPRIKDIPVKNSPLWKGDPAQQLFYYSARAWARRWVPEVLMGVYTPDEIAVRAEEEGDVAERATSFAAMEARAADVIQDAIIEEIKPAAEATKPPPQPASAVVHPDAPADAASPASGAGTATAAGTPGSGVTTTTGSAGSEAGSTGEALTSLAEEGIPGFLKRLAGDPEAERPTETANAQAVAAGQGSSGSATTASTASAEDNSFPGDNGRAAGEIVVGDQVVQPEDVIAEGYPEVDEVYHLTGDAWTDYGTRETYRNGAPVGTARREDHILIYEDHRPERAEPMAATIPQDFAVYAGVVAGAQDWPTVTPALGALKKSQAWADAPEEMRRRIHAMSFERLRELVAGGYKFDFLDNLHSYRCYIDWETDEDGLLGNRRVIHASKAWMDLPTEIKITFDKAHDASVAWIQAKKGAVLWRKRQKAKLCAPARYEEGWP